MIEQPSTEVTILKIIDRKVWCESDIFGDRHVMVQHDIEGEKPFCYATFHYDWRYTSNSGTRGAAENLARSLGATGEIEWRSRPLDLEKQR